MSNPVTVFLSIPKGLKRVPGIAQFTDWCQLAYQSDQPVQVSIKVIDINESRKLNKQYRNKDQPTNVLSFPLHVAVDDKTELLGDLAICAPIVQQEAEDQGKPETARWAHMVVHGMLHLQGYDHAIDCEAKIMEEVEIDLMEKLGFSNPYLANNG